jgi:hypothetical protein
VKVQVGKDTITRTSSFKYLGQIFTEKDYDLQQLRPKSRKQDKYGQELARSSRKKQIATSKLCQNSLKLSFRAFYYIWV